MTESLTNTIILAVIFLLLFGSAEILYRVLQVNAEITRKYVHIATGFLSLFFPLLIADNLLVLFLCASFFLILIISFKTALLPSINAVSRRTYGSLAYPVIVYLCYMIYDSLDNLMFYYIPILILAISDPIANLVGNKLPYGKYRIMAQSKTVSGSSAFFLTAFLTSLLLSFYFADFHFSWIGLVLSVVIAITTTVAEALSLNGFDNITIPVCAMIILYIFHEFII